MSLTFGLGDRKKLGAVWKIMQAFDMDQDKLHLLVTAAVREALATRNENPEMAASLVGATLQRQIGPRDNKMRLSIRCNNLATKSIKWRDGNHVSEVHINYLLGV